MIAQLLREHFALSYPGHDLLPDANLELLGADVVGLATSYLDEGRLTDQALQILRRCVIQADTIVPQLEGEARTYFEGVRAIAVAVLQSVDLAHAV